MPGAAAAATAVVVVVVDTWRGGGMPRRPSRLGNSRGPGTRREGRGRPGDGGGTERNESCMKEAPRMGGLRMAAKRVLFLESRYEQFLNSTFGLQRRSVKVQQCVIVDLSVPAAPSNERGGGFFCSPVRSSSLQVFKWGGGGGAGSSTLKFHFSPE